MNTLDNINYNLLYNKNFYGQALFRDHFLNKKLSFKIFDNAVIFPIKISQAVCALNQNLQYIENSCNDISALQYLNTNSEISISNDNAIFLGRFIGVWGHFVTDDLRRLWFLKSHYFNDFKNFIPVYFNFLPNKNHLKFFDILNINHSKIHNISSPVRFKKVLIPDECFITDYDPDAESNLKYLFTQDYLNLIDLVRDYANKNKSNLLDHNFYFSYSKYKSGKSVGECHLENYFKSHHYKIIYPENLSLDEQLNILANCHNFASTIGSCSHNMIFLNDNSNVILIPRANYLTPHQLVIDKLHNLKISYVDSSFSFLAANRNPGEGPFLYFVSKNLKSLFNDNSIINVSFHDYKKYFRYAMGFNLGRRFGFNSGGGNPKTHNYYSGQIASDYYGALLNSRFPLFKKFSNLARNFIQKYFMKYVVK